MRVLGFLVFIFSLVLSVTFANWRHTQTLGAHDEASTAPPASNVMTCSDRYTELRAFLTAAPPILHREPDGTVLINPLKPRSAYTGADAALLDSTDQQNLDRNLRPLFEGLKATLIRQLQQMRDGVQRADLVQRVSQLQLVVLGRARCLREDSTPFAMGFTEKTRLSVQMCPFTSHMTAASLVTVMAHELAHAFDLCDTRIGMPQQRADRLCDPRHARTPEVAALADFPYRQIHCCTAAVNEAGDDSSHGDGEVCYRDIEVWANHVAAQLASDFLSEQARLSAPLVRLPSDPRLRMIALMNQGIDTYPGASPEYVGRPFLRAPFFEHELGCRGTMPAPGCATTDFR